MNPETIQAIQVALAPVAEKLGQGAGYGWEVIVKAQFMSGVVTLICTTLLSVALFFTVRFVYKSKLVASLNEDIAKPLVIAITLLASLVLIPQIGVWYYEGLFNILAPEYKAIEFLLSLAGK